MVRDRKRGARPKRRISERLSQQIKIMTKMDVVAVAMLKPGRPGWRPGPPEQFVVVTKRISGEWHLHGGKVNVGERRKAAAAHETLEETGVRLHPQQLRRVGRFESDCLQLTLYAAQAHESCEPQVMEKDKALVHTWVSIEQLHATFRRVVQPQRYSSTLPVVQRCLSNK